MYYEMTSRLRHSHLIKLSFGYNCANIAHVVCAHVCILLELGSGPNGLTNFNTLWVDFTSACPVILACVFFCILSSMFYVITLASLPPDLFFEMLVCS